METNKEIPSIKEYFESRGHGSSTDVIQSVRNLTQYHLTKQVELIAEKAFKIYEGYGFTNTGNAVRQSILQTGEEYKNSVK